METVVLVMMMLVCFNFVVKQTYNSAYAVMLSAVLCALFTGFMWPYAIEQSRTQVSDWLSDPQLMLDVAVVLTVEVAVQMYFCMLMAGNGVGESRKSRYLRIALQWFPGLLVFPVLFSIVVAAIFSFPGTSFALVAWLLAGAVLVAVPLLSWVVKWMLPENEIRLELLFLSNALIAIMGIIATVNGTTAVAGIAEVDWHALAGVLAIVVAGLCCGYGLYYRKGLRIKD